MRGMRKEKGESERQKMKDVAIVWMRGIIGECLLAFIIYFINKIYK